MNIGVILLAMLTMTTSWYGPGFDGNTAASGEVFNQNAHTAAHRTLPFGTLLLVTRGESRVLVRINDRGPYCFEALKEGRLAPHPTRQLDLSRAPFRALAPLSVGVMKVQVYVLRYGNITPLSYLPLPHFTKGGYR